MKGTAVGAITGTISPVRGFSTLVKTVGAGVVAGAAVNLIDDTIEFIEAN
ncbi:hypothetical protein PN836_011120 [Ningiella sp. W23]